MELFTNTREQRKWDHDISMFAKFKEYHASCSLPNTAEYWRGRMVEIQQRWPQHIKESEIPPAP